MKVTVHSKAPNKFRRAGFEFDREPREIEVDEKTLQMLKGEPMLVVVEMPEPVEGKAKTKSNKD